MIIGTEILEELKIDLKFSECIITWGNASTTMKDRDTFLNQDLMEFYIYAIESTTVQEATDRMKRILDAKYEKADLDKTVNDITYLNSEEKSQLLNLLKEYEYLFDGMLGIWNIEPLNLELKDGVKPYHAKPFPVPKAYEETLKKEVDHLCKIGVLKQINRSEWATPTFIIPKKNGQVRFVSDFRELNK